MITQDSDSTVQLEMFCSCFSSMYIVCVYEWVCVCVCVCVCVYVWWTFCIISLSKIYPTGDHPSSTSSSTESLNSKCSVSSNNTSQPSDVPRRPLSTNKGHVAQGLFWNIIPNYELFNLLHNTYTGT